MFLRGHQQMSASARQLRAGVQARRTGEPGEVAA
jgi:hypothetical protein